MTELEKRRFTLTASETTRGRKRTDQHLAELALSKPRLVGEGETQLLELLREQGIEAEHQFPVGKYNLDIAIGSVAVEVHRSTHHPLSTTQFHQRTEDLISLGWPIIFVWLNPKRGEYLANTDNLISLVKLARTDPAAFGKYRVIRADGSDGPLLPKKGKHAAGIGIPESLLNA